MIRTQKKANNSLRDAGMFQRQVSDHNSQSDFSLSLIVSQRRSCVLQSSLRYAYIIAFKFVFSLYIYLPILHHIEKISHSSETRRGKKRSSQVDEPCSSSSSLRRMDDDDSEDDDDNDESGEYIRTFAFRNYGTRFLMIKIDRIII